MAIELRQVVRVVDGQTHIYETDLKLEKGAFNILLGTTLSGKTSLLRLMAGLDRPHSGQVWFDGADVTGVAVRKRRVAMVYQAFINYPHFSVFENIASPLRVARVADAEVRARVGRIAELLKLSALLEREVSQLSGGQQQRTALARALVKDASLVLLDEPLANLDYKLREQLRDELPRLFADSGATVVYGASEPEEALLLGGYTAALREGRVVQFGRTIDVYRHPATLECAEVFSDPPLNRMRLVKQDGVIYLGERNAGIASWSAPERLREKSDGEYILGVRPHHVTLAPGPGLQIPLQGKVQIAELSGSASLIHLSAHGYNWISATRGVHPCNVHDDIEVYIQLAHCFYFTADGHAIGDAPGGDDGRD